MPVRPFGFRLLPLVCALILNACQAVPPAPSAVPAVAHVAQALSVSVRFAPYRTLAEVAAYTPTDVTRLTLSLHAVPDPLGNPTADTPVLDAEAAPIVREVSGAQDTVFSGLTPGVTYRLKAEAFGADGLISLPAQAEAAFPVEGATAIALTLTLKPKAVTAAARGGVTLLPGGYAPVSEAAIAQPNRTWTWQWYGTAMFAGADVPAGAWGPRDRATDPLTGNGLLVTSGSGQLMVQALNGLGAAIGPRRTVRSGLSATIKAAIAFNTSRREYVVVSQSDGNAVLWMQRFDAAGLALGAPVHVSANAHMIGSDRLTFNPIDREFALSFKVRAITLTMFSEDGRFLRAFSPGPTDLVTTCEDYDFALRSPHGAAFDPVSHTYRFYITDCFFPENDDRVPAYILRAVSP